MLRADRGQLYHRVTKKRGKKQAQPCGWLIRSQEPGGQPERKRLGGGYCYEAPARINWSPNVVAHPDVRALFARRKKTAKKNRLS